MDAAMTTHRHRLERLERMFPLRERTLGAQRWSYRSCGDGERTAVLLHGIGSTSASWFDLACVLGERYRIVAWDAPGYGRSSPLAQRCPRATDYAEALEGLLAALGVDRCALVGHSLGAMMAAAYVAQRPQGRAEQLLLVSPAGGYGAPRFDAERERVRDTRLQTLEALGVAGMAARRADRLLSSAASSAAREWVRWNMASLDADGYRQATELLCGDDIGRYAPAAVPVACLCGEQDVITPPAACRAVAEEFGVPLVLMPGCGHASPVEAPRLLAARLQGSIENQGEGCE
jgi:pimeloyl-ACP methyl ester carboxylesterase